MQSKSLPDLLLIKNARILDPMTNKEFNGEILIRDGKIETIGNGIDPGDAEILDVSGKVVTHGFCDIHAHFREPGREDKETLKTGANAALAGGFTTVCVMPNTNPPLDSPESIRFIIEKSDELPVNIYPIGTITIGQKGKDLAEMNAMFDEGAVAFSDDGIPVMDSGVLRLALEYALPLEVPIINHAEDITLKGDGQINEGVWSTKLGLAGIPDVSESSMISRDVQIANYVKGKLHIPHISSRKSLEWVKWAKNAGNNVTCEVSPHHLYFTDDSLESYNTNLKVSPPIRSEDDRQALIEGLKNGIIDCIATDHAPHTIEEKEAPFNWAPSGMIGLESAFGAVWKVLYSASYPLLDLVKKMTVIPRKIMGFDPDLFAQGTEAQLVIFDPDAEWVFSIDNIFSKSKNSPFVGEKLFGKISTVILKEKLFTLS